MVVTFLLLVLSRIAFLKAWTTTSLVFVSTTRSMDDIDRRCTADSSSIRKSTKKRPCSSLLASGNNNNDNKSGGADEFFSLDPEDKPKNNGDTTPKLGIDLGPMLDPLTEQEAAELKAAATEIINESVAEGLDEIEKLRERMKREFERKKVAMAAASERNTARESAKLMSKIDALTDTFLENTELSRKATKLAAAADQAMEGRGVDLGAWGNLGGATVATGTLLGSVENAQQQVAKSTTVSGKSTDESTGMVETVQQQSNRIIVLADPSQDQYAKQLIDPLTVELQKSLPSLQVDVFKPTATLPIGGNNAACALIFCGSFSDKSSVYKAMDRILRKTLQPGGAIGQPPTQLVAISTIGTERTNKMPYSLQNLMGGKLDQRRQIEESLINIVRQRAIDPALDYTICKFGELKGSVSEPFQLAFGDVLDGSTATDTAVTVLSQAIAFQPSARNTTLCCVGSLAESASNQELLDDAFLKLDGPELLRTELVTSSDKTDANFEPLAEYMREWADLLATTGKGLTTPIRAEVSSFSGRIPGVTRSASVKLLFLPTATGKNYLSRDEEKDREKQGSSSAKPPPLKKAPKEGGIEVLVEKTKDGAIRVRAKRCNYAEDAVIKELSEETILSRLRKSIDVWLKDHQIR